MTDRATPDYDAQVFECQECGKRTADDGADALLGWFRDGDGELSFCAECGPELGPPSQDILDRFHAMYAREHAGRILALLDDPTTVFPPGDAHVLNEYGTTDCPVERVRAEADGGECSACGGHIFPPGSDGGCLVTDQTDTTLTDTERLIARAEAACQPCGACDAGLPMGCNCDPEPRAVIAGLLDLMAARVAAARAERDTEWRVLLEAHIQQREDDRYVLHGVARFALCKLVADGPGALIEGADQ